MSKPIFVCTLVVALIVSTPAWAEFAPWASRVLYNRLTPGMTTETVLKVMGSEPTKVTQYTEMGSRYEVYQWNNPDRSTMSLLFQDNQLRSKSAHFRPSLSANN